MNLRGALPAMEPARARGEHGHARPDATASFEVPAPPAPAAAPARPSNTDAGRDASATRGPVREQQRPARETAQASSGTAGTGPSTPAPARAQRAGDGIARDVHADRGRMRESPADAARPPAAAMDATEAPAHGDAVDGATGDASPLARPDAPGLPERMLALLQSTPALAAAATVTEPATRAGELMVSTSPTVDAALARSTASVEASPARAHGAQMSRIAASAPAPSPAFHATPTLAASADGAFDALTGLADAATAPAAPALRSAAAAAEGMTEAGVAMAVPTPGVAAGPSPASAATTPPEAALSPRAPPALASIGSTAVRAGPSGIAPTGAGAVANGAASVTNVAAVAAPGASGSPAFADTVLFAIAGANAAPASAALPPGIERDGIDALAEALALPSDAPGVAAARPVSEPASSGRVQFTAPLALPKQPGLGFDDAFDQRIVWMAEQRIGQAEMRVSPDGLGPIDVRLQIDGHRVTAQFHAASADVRQALEAGMDRLRDLLGERGMQLADAQVGQQRSQGDRGPAAAARTAEGEAAADDGSVVTTVRSLRARGLVDTYA